MKKSSFLVVLLLALPGLAQTTQQMSGVHAAVLNTYSFEPHTLDNAGLQQHSVQLDRFWENAKAQRTLYIPALRAELQRSDNPRFFYYDGSMLLLQLSDTPPDRDIAVQAIARCDLRDVQSHDYFIQVHRLAVAGANVTPAALHVLDDAKFKVFIPQHVLTLGQDYSFLYLVLPMPEDTWVSDGIRRLEREKDATAVKSLLSALWYAQTKTADDALRQFASDTKRPAALRDLAKQALARNQSTNPTKSAAATLPAEDALRAKRRQLMARISDEALIELDEVTAQLIARRSR
jgi:hypothetical protein